jgi:hypothetical protein
MNLTILVVTGVVLSIIFHFIGVYAKAKYIVWVMLVLMWAGSISFAMNEISPKGYDYIKSIKGKYVDVDAQIEKALPKISLYEMLEIKKSYDEHQKVTH